jgi:cell division protease FtsH
VDPPETRSWSRKNVPSGKSSSGRHGLALVCVSIGLLIIACAIVLASPRMAEAASVQQLTFGQFQQKVQDHQIDSPVVIDTKTFQVQGTVTNDGSFEVGYTPDFPMATYLRSNGIDFTTSSGSSGTSWGALLIYLLLPAVIVIWLLMARRRAVGGVGNQVMGFGKATAKRVNVDQPRVTFDDVAGVDEAVEELQEIKDYLSNPTKFTRLGAKMPTGVLLFGPPGTGKTLLARAVAGEAGVPFFSISGSDFVEMFVGVGASRVRDLFQQAKENQPCIIFIDEIDAVGRHRGAGIGGGSDEREQTLNQLLVQMDGFEPHDKVVVMAGTNRPDILDPALLRPGRFDRQILVDQPDKSGRRGILAIHARGKPLEANLDLDLLAGQTPGFTGADLANLMNEAALLAARRNKRLIGMPELEEAILRIIAGPEKKSRILSERERLITAYHETGHALVAHYLPYLNPVQKISIVSRGHALGFTVTQPIEDRFMMQKQEILNSLAQMVGGRVAEEITFDDITTGAADDLQKATEMARRMVSRYGMSEELGLFAVSQDNDQPFAGRELGGNPEYSEDTAKRIDLEIRRLIDDAHKRAREVLTKHRPQLELVAQTLLERETVDQADFEALLADTPGQGKPVPADGSNPKPAEIIPGAAVLAEVPPAASSGPSGAGTSAHQRADGAGARRRLRP